MIIEQENYENLKTFLIERGFSGVTVIGDVHGMTEDFENHVDVAMEKNHFIIQLGDIVDYGPDSVGCVDLMYSLVMDCKAAFVVGNHERKLAKYITQFREGKIRIQIKGGIVQTVEQLTALDEATYNGFEAIFTELMDNARHHIVLDNNLFVHASATPTMWGNTSNRLKGFDENRAMFGEVDRTNPRNEDGYPNRLYNWIDDIPDGHTVYVGHAYLDLYNPVVKEGKKGGRAIFVDTGSGKEGSLSSVEISL